jgi:hypothetical protein
MNPAMDSSLHAGDSMSAEHSGDSPDTIPDESSPQSRSEKQSEHESDMIVVGGDTLSFSSHRL